MKQITQVKSEMTGVDSRGDIEEDSISRLRPVDSSENAVVALRPIAKVGERPCADDKGDRLLDPSKPYVNAREFVAACYQHEDGPTIHFYDGRFYEWVGNHYKEVPYEKLDAAFYRFFDKAVQPTKIGETRPFDPNRRKVKDIVHATRALTYVDADDSVPQWLTESKFDAQDLIPCANGLLHLPSTTLLNHTPLLFNLNALDYDFEPDAPEPTRWLRFLQEIWPSETDSDCLNTLQEMFGYCLSVDTRQQKIFLILGPKRSGKGTIARVLTALLGRDNVCSPTLSGLATNFGMQPIIDKKVATITDARIGGRTDHHLVVERLLSISGEDNITADRKHKIAWTGKFNARFVILTNEMPRLADASGALANRFIIMRMTKSFLGKEDTRLTEKLLEERTGILNWAIEGLARLRARGHFVQPASGREIMGDLSELSSPVESFVREVCITGPEHGVACEHLYAAWRLWCQSNGRDFTGSLQSFGRDLRAAYPELQVSRPSAGSGGKRQRFYRGIGLADK